MPPTLEDWPALPLAPWKATCDTLHLYSQIPGKIRLKLAPPEPEWNHVALYLTARGLTTSPMPYGSGSFELAFDFVAHKFVIAVSDGKTKSVDLTPRTVSEFYAEVMGGLRECGIEVEISDKPQEIANPIPFSDDEVHGSYDREAVEKFFRVLTSVDQVFKAYRAPFRGRHTPVQFWWGTFDLGYERFSGKALTPPPNAGLLRRVGGDAEQFNVGFWPGDNRFPEPAFFSYAYLPPDGLESASIKPAEAFWHKDIGEFILRYEDVRRSHSPRTAILDFLSSTYEAGAALLGWPSELREKQS